MNAGLLLIRAPLDGVRRWAERGLVAARLTPLGAWVAVQAAEATSRAADPYAAVMPALASRPVGARLRPAIGFFDTGASGVLTVQAPGWQAEHRWLFWTADTGPTGPAHLPIARIADLVAAVGVSGPARAGDIHSAVLAPAGSPRAWLHAVHEALGLPGVELLTGRAGGTGPVVEPSRRSVRSFDAVASEERVHDAELEDRR
ncbi:MAG: hypothetical protein ABI131_12430 [Nostocoides sp.]